jgi:hypothetical protein
MGAVNGAPLGNGIFQSVAGWTPDKLQHGHPRRIFKLTGKVRK